MATSVKYNGTEITPTPFVVRNGNPTNVGGRRWGYNESISLQGVVTGAQGTGKIGELTSLFQEGYKNLVVESDGDNSYMSMTNCVLRGISIGENMFAQETDNAIPYTVNLVSYQNTSGVVDVADKYAYNQGKNGIVSISHQVQARGVHDGNDPIDNAYNFVSLFTGISPVTVASPTFISQGNAFLVGSSERIDRTNGLYSVTENWSFETGSNDPFTTVSTVTENTARDAEYPSIDLSVNFNGPLTGTMSDMRVHATAFDYYGEIEGYGINTGDLYLNSFSMSETEPSTISASVNFISGFAAENTTGAWRHSVNLEWDEIDQVQRYSLRSEFKVNGPREHRATQIEGQKTHLLSQFGSFLPFLYHTVLGSELYSEFGQSYTLNPLPDSITMEEGTTQPTLSFSASFNDRDFFTTSTETLPNGLTYPISIGESNLKMEFNPEKWIFEGQPSNNIEGHGIVQDLNCKTRDAFSITTSVQHQSNSYNNGTELSTEQVKDELLGMHETVRNSFGITSYIRSSNFNSGMHSYSLQKHYIGKDPIYPDFTNNKFYGFQSMNYNTRGAGHQFGF